MLIAIGIEMRQVMTAPLFPVIALLAFRTVLVMTNPYRGSIQPEQENLIKLLDALRASDR